MQSESSISEELSTRLDRVASQYPDFDENCRFLELGLGNINDTFLVVGGKFPFIIQRINAGVFAEPWKVAQNSAVVSSHLNSNIVSNNFTFPRVLKTGKGKSWHIDSIGETWRAQTYIAGSTVFENVRSTEQAAEVGRCLAVFHRGVESVPQDRLEQVLPGFHNLPLYLQKFEAAVAGSPMRITPDLRFCLDGIVRYGRMGHFFEAAVSRGDVAARVVHGDPKVSNVLFNVRSGRAVAMIDLDTVGSGLVLYDIGDCLRSCCGPAEKDSSGAARCDTGMLAAVLAGYLGEGSLGRFELEHIHDALLLVSFELGVRFVTDYLQGNRYFKVVHPDDNLNRAVVQFQLVENIAGQRRVIEELVAEAGKRIHQKR